VGVTEVLDKEIHREIREMVLGQIPREMHPWSSHEGQGDITLYRLVGDQRVQVAEPDIVARNGRRIMVIEIELSDRPKMLLGDAFAVWTATNGSCKNEDVTLESKSLMIVVRKPNRQTSNRKSGKPSQWTAIEKIVRSTLDFDSFMIANDTEVSSKLDEWNRANQDPK